MTTEKTYFVRLSYISAETGERVSGPVASFFTKKDALSAARKLVKNTPEKSRPSEAYIEGIETDYETGEEYPIFDAAFSVEGGLTVY